MMIDDINDIIVVSDMFESCAAVFVSLSSRRQFLGEDESAMKVMLSVGLDAFCTALTKAITKRKAETLAVV
ncbi:hypothetical protein RB195_001560 [Necator americanus]|uniref:Uncharacterized protein n=1 Tax=Necator americanus TaxID=51031 RepID=A0ABR1DF34_NECAM